MKLMTKRLEHRFAQVVCQAEGKDPLFIAKFFNPTGAGTWYASEFDGEDVLFGLMAGFDIEYGYFSLKELQETVGPMGLQIERDVHFEPKPVGELEEWHRKQREEKGGDTTDNPL